MNNGYLHFSVIFKAGNLNYGESIGNITSLKKLTIEGMPFSYVSRQAIRYDIVRILEEECGYDKAEVDKESGVVQFSEAAKINEYPEIDFFGYMKTEKKNKQRKAKNEQNLDNQDQQEESVQDEQNQSPDKTKIRKAIVRLTDAISLEPFYNEIDFSTNMGLASRAGLNNDIYQSEIHKSFYTYSLTIDLDKVGIDENYKIKLPKDERVKRLNALLYAVKTLNRDIKGKRENLSPLFIIGGIYTSGNPFFYNQLKLLFSKDGTSINDKIVKSILEVKMFNGETVKDRTYLGFLNGHFDNIDDLGINGEKKLTIEQFFETLGKDIESYYED